MPLVWYIGNLLSQASAEFDVRSGGLVVFVAAATVFSDDYLFAGPATKQRHLLHDGGAVR